MNLKLKLALSALAVTGKVAAQSFILNPENGHYYAAVLSNGISWADAQTQASQMTFLGGNGYLATVTTENENNFLVQNFFSTFNATKISYAAQALIGGYQSPIGETNPQNGWRWANNEGTFPGQNGATGFDSLFSNWASASDAAGDPYDSPSYNGEPNDGTGGAGSEQYLSLFRFSSHPGRWNDIGGFAGESSVSGYIVEVTPVPEPAAYGAIAAFGLLALVVSRRRNQNV